MTQKMCTVCGKRYQDEYLAKNGPDNDCCSGNLKTWKGASPDPPNGFLFKGASDV